MVTPIGVAEPEQMQKKNERKRGYVIALIVGYFAKFAVYLALVFIMMLIQRFLSPAITGVPYVRNTGPVIPGSQEWLVLQFFAIPALIACGAAAIHWSPQRSWAALATLVGIHMLLGLVSTFTTDSSLIKAYWVVVCPLIILISGVLLRCYENRT